jgi:hypothetical protein
MNDLAQFQPAFNGVNTLLAVSTDIETEQITNGNLKLKGNSSFNGYYPSLNVLKRDWVVTRCSPLCFPGPRYFSNKFELGEVENLPGLHSSVV